MVVLKLFQNFLMPSAFIVLFFLLGIIFWGKKKSRGKTLIISGAALYLLFSISPVSDFLLMSLEEKYERLPVENIDKAEKVVLLLGGRESDVLRGSEVLRLWHLSDGEMEIIVSGIDPFTTKNEEAYAVRNFFEHRGVDENNVIIEGKSHNTRENVENVKKIVGDNPFFLVTSAYHMDRSLREFERLGANPIPAPTDFKRKRVITYGFFDFIPRGSNLRNSNLAFHEYIGIVYYQFISLLGK